MYVQKKPMNTIQGPIYPFIQKDPPRFYKTKKYWTAHTDDIIREQNDNTQLYDHAVLAVSRDENQYRYGKRSYIPKVNKEFRPPLVDPEYDLTPLSRTPRPRTYLRINPEGAEVARSQNMHGMDVSAMIDERKMKASVRPSFTIKYEKPLETVLPDLKFKMPQVSVFSGSNVPLKEDAEHCDIELKRRAPSVFGSASSNTPLKMDHTSPLEDLLLQYKNPQVHADAGIETNTKFDALTPLEDLELSHNRPQISASSGTNTPMSMNATTPLEDLELMPNGPQVSADSGMEHPYHQNQEAPQENMYLANRVHHTSTTINPSGPASVPEYQKLNNVNTINPIQISHKLTPNYHIQQTTHNENPYMKQTLEWDRKFDAAPVRPMGIRHQYPTLKQKK